MSNPDQGYSLKLDREYGVLLRNRAEIERRTVKEVAQEAIRQYEANLPEYRGRLAFPKEKS